MVHNRTWSISLPYDEVLIAMAQFTTHDGDYPASIWEHAARPPLYFGSPSTTFKLENLGIFKKEFRYDCRAVLSWGKRRDFELLLQVGQIVLFDKSSLSIPNCYTFDALLKLHRLHCDRICASLLKGQRQINGFLDLIDAFSDDLEHLVSFVGLFVPHAVLATYTVVKARIGVG